jgi:hypothetical protein
MWGISIRTDPSARVLLPRMDLVANDGNFHVDRDRVIVPGEVVGWCTSEGAFRAYYYWPEGQYFPHPMTVMFGSAGACKMRCNMEFRHASIYMSEITLECERTIRYDISRCEVCSGTGIMKTPLDAEGVLENESTCLECSGIGMLERGN